MHQHPSAWREAWSRFEVGRLVNPLDQLIVACELIGGGTTLCIGAGIAAFSASWGWAMVAVGAAIGALGAIVLLRSHPRAG
jgi:hypothetical protein